MRQLINFLAIGFIIGGFLLPKALNAELYLHPKAYYGQEKYMGKYHYQENLNLFLGADTLYRGVDIALRFKLSSSFDSYNLELDSLYLGYNLAELRGRQLRGGFYYGQENIAPSYLRSNIYHLKNNTDGLFFHYQASGVKMSYGGYSAFVGGNKINENIVLVEKEIPLFDFYSYYVGRGAEYPQKTWGSGIVQKAAYGDLFWSCGGQYVHFFKDTRIDKKDESMYFAEAGYHPELGLQLGAMGYWRFFKEQDKRKNDIINAGWHFTSYHCDFFGEYKTSESYYEKKLTCQNKLLFDKFALGLESYYSKDKYDEEIYGVGLFVDTFLSF